MTRASRHKPSIARNEKRFASGFNTVCRIKKLNDLIQTHKIVRILEAHTGLTGLIVEKTKVLKHGRPLEFDGIWEGSLADALSKAKPDNSVVDMTSRLHTINEILDVTTKPMIVDANNGGLIEHFGFTVRTMERLGVSAVVIEDKINRKRNSLEETHLGQEQDSIENFCKKIQIGKRNQSCKDFMIISRIESLIFQKSLSDALARAEAYIQAGSDGILIHSKAQTANEILDFCKKYKKIPNRVPLTVIPTTYNDVTESQLIRSGVNIVIYANHLIRSAYPAMTHVAETILKSGRAKEAEPRCLPVAATLRLIPDSEFD